MQSAPGSKGTIATLDLETAQSATEALANRRRRLRGRIGQASASARSDTRLKLHKPKTAPAPLNCQRRSPLVAIHEEAVSATNNFPDEAIFLNPRISGQNPSADFRFWQIVLKKVFFGTRTKFFRTADAFGSRRREGPHRFTQERPGTFVLVL